MFVMDGKRVKPSSEDAISSCPDEILARILSFLPTKRAASTSVLSKRWRNLFPLINHLFASQHRLILDDSDLVYAEEEGQKNSINKKTSFSNFVDKTLLSGSTSITKLSLKLDQNDPCLASVDTWIRKALERGLMDLDLDLTTRSPPVTRLVPWEGMLPHLPCSVFANKTLVKLTLGIGFGRRIIGFYPEVFLPVLKSLSLHGIWSRCEGFCHKMLPGCPILEDLSLHYLNCVFPKRLTPGGFTISHKTLKRLTLHYNNSLYSSSVKIFDTPSLVYLDYSGLAPLRYTSRATFMDSLVEAKLDVGMSEILYPNETSGEMFDLSPIVNWISNVKILSLTSASVDAMYAWFYKRLPLFSNLVKLSFESNTKNGWEMLPVLLQKSPKLINLVLKGLHCVENEGVCIDSNKVEVLEIYGFKGSVREFSQVKCFLSQMQFLQVMKVEIDADGNKKLRLITRLTDLPERSSKFQIHLL